MGSSLLTAPPSTGAVPPELVLAPTATIVSGTSITLGCTTAPGSNASFTVFASKAMSQGKYYNSNYRFITKWLTADTNSFDISVAYVAVFGTVPVTGEKIFIKLIATDTVTGLENQAQAISKTV